MADNSFDNSGAPAKSADENQTGRADDAPPKGDSSKEHKDRIADEWGDESFPSSDPPAHY